MFLTNNAISLTFTLSDILTLTGIICLIVFTIYIILTLKSLIELFKKTTELIAESSMVVEDLQAKSKALDSFVEDTISNGKGVLKVLSAFKR